MSNIVVDEFWEKDGRTLEPIKIQFEHGQILGEEVIGTRNLNNFFTGHLYTGHAINQHQKSTRLLSNPSLPSRFKNKTKVVTLESDGMLYVGSSEGVFNQSSLTSSSLSVSTTSTITLASKKKTKDKSRLKTPNPEPSETEIKDESLSETSDTEIKDEPPFEENSEPEIKDEPLSDSEIKDEPISDSEIKDEPLSDSEIKDEPLSDSEINDEALIEPSGFVISAPKIKKEPGMEPPVKIKKEPESPAKIKKGPATTFTTPKIKQEPVTKSSTPKIKQEPVTKSNTPNIKQEPVTKSSSTPKIKKEPGIGSNSPTIKLEETESKYESPKKVESGPGMNTYILVKRKGSPFAKLYETTEITVSPYLTDITYIEEEERNLTRTLKDKQLANADLIKEFGSKKKRLYLERVEKNQVSDMNDSIMSAAADARIDDTPEEDISDNSILQLIPPCNREATLPSEVYNIQDLLTDEELQELDWTAQTCLTCTEEDIMKWKKHKIFSDLLYSSLKEFQKTPDDPQTILSMKLILYAEILIRLYKMRPHEMARVIPQFPDAFPHNLVQKAFDLFTTVNALYQRNRSEELKNKTCCYIMVLVLLANQFKFDIQLMSTIFQIHIKKLLTLTKAVGMTVGHNSTTKEYAAVLKLPLPRQVEKRGAKRRLRR